MGVLFDIIWFLLFLVVAFQLPAAFMKQASVAERSTLKKLAVFHFFFGVVFFFFTRNGGGDAWGYYIAAQNLNADHIFAMLKEGEGTAFMQALNYFPVRILGMSFFANTMLYSLLGFIGIGFFYAVAKELIPFNKVLYGYAVFPLIFFLPNLHFWSAGVGKDTILFISIGMFAYGLLKPAKRIVLIVVALFLATAIRPHITLFLLLAFGIAYLFGGRASKFQRVAFSVLLLGAGIALLPVVTQFIGVEELSTENVTRRAEGQVGNLTQGSGSAVDVNSYPWPLKIATFLYRPLFFDARSVGSLLSSVDNLILLVLTYHAFRFRPFETFRKAPFIAKGFLIFGILGTIAFSFSLGNLGVMIRMKNMFTPGILIYFMWCYSYRLYVENVLTGKLRSKKTIHAESNTVSAEQ